MRGSDLARLYVGPREGVRTLTLLAAATGIRVLEKLREAHRVLRLNDVQPAAASRIAATARPRSPFTAYPVSLRTECF